MIKSMTNVYSFTHRLLLIIFRPVSQIPDSNSSHTSYHSFFFDCNQQWCIIRKDYYFMILFMQNSKRLQRMRGIMTQLKTPFYRIKESDLQYDIRLLKDSLVRHWGNYIPGYSVKTNSLPWLLTYLQKQGFYAEVVSDTEYDLAKRLGYSDDKIIYNSEKRNRMSLSSSSGFN